MMGVLQLSARCAVPLRLVLVMNFSICEIYRRFVTIESRGPL